MGELREGCKEPYRRQVGCIISLALTDSFTLYLQNHVPQSRIAIDIHTGFEMFGYSELISLLP